MRTNPPFLQKVISFQNHALVAQSAVIRARLTHYRHLLLLVLLKPSILCQQHLPDRRRLAFLLLHSRVPRNHRIIRHLHRTVVRAHRHSRRRRRGLRNHRLRMNRRFVRRAVRIRPDGASSLLRAIAINGMGSLPQSKPILQWRERSKRVPCAKRSFRRGFGISRRSQSVDRRSARYFDSTPLTKHAGHPCRLFPAIRCIYLTRLPRSSLRPASALRVSAAIRSLSSPRVASSSSIAPAPSPNSPTVRAAAAACPPTRLPARAASAGQADSAHPRLRI